MKTETFNLSWFPKSQKSRHLPLLAMGAESAGGCAFFDGKKIIFLKNFGDLLVLKNYERFKKEILKILRSKKPKTILGDLHPFYKPTLLGKEIANKLKIDFFPIQHHLAHIFASLGEDIIKKRKILKKNFIGVACDGTGYGLDGKIWGGEVFKFEYIKSCFKPIRIGHLENQILIGGDAAVKEPARVAISILSKFLKKKLIYKFVKKFYTPNQFELIWNQLNQNFNCQETSSTGRVLDAVSVILGFCKNKREFKHQPTLLLEKHSLSGFYKISPSVVFDKKEKNYILLTTSLFKYLISNLHKQKREKLATISQCYIAEGFRKIAFKFKKEAKNFYLSGGLSYNKIISSYLSQKGFFLTNTISRGDEGISIGQIFYFLLTNSGN